MDLNGIGIMPRAEIVQALAETYRSGEHYIIAPGPGATAFVLGQLEDAGPVTLYCDPGSEPCFTSQEPESQRLLGLVEYMNPAVMASLVVAPKAPLAEVNLWERLTLGMRQPKEMGTGELLIIATGTPDTLTAYPALLRDFIAIADPPLAERLAQVTISSPHSLN